LGGLSLLPLLTLQVGAADPAFANAAFGKVWERTDAPVASGAVKRSWLWGPQANSYGAIEEYKEGVNGKRLVQYFDKSRMELNNPSADPNSPFYVTNGLLTVELISGRMQIGNNSFVTRQPSRASVTGDSGDTNAPTYASFAGVSNAVQDHRDPDRTGQVAIATLSKEGKVGSDPSKASIAGVKIAYYERTTGHNIPQAMWDFLNSKGPVNCRGEACLSPTAQGHLSEPWFYASGLPISDAYWTRVTISGKAADVLVQAYERRVLTYVPTNPEGFRVEMGNIGQHYYDWRYPSGTTPAPAPTYAILPPPPPLSRYSVDVLGDISPATLDKLKASGAGAVRFNIGWGGIEPQDVSPDKYNWATADSGLRALADKELQPITLIDGCPEWACVRPEGPLRAERVPDFVEFMAALAARYGKSPYNAHYWELWNEPDSAGGPQNSYNWGTHGALYASMLKAIRPAVRAADPVVQIVLGGVAYDNFQEGGGPFYRPFLDDLLNAGGGQYLDVFNFHYYVQNIHWCSLSEKLKELRAKLSAKGLNIPIISTEVGFTSEQAAGGSDDLQSLYVAQAYAQSAGEGMLSATWFAAKDLNIANPGLNIFRLSGLLDLSGKAKPSLSAYKVASTQIGQRPATRALGKADGLAGTMRGFEFGATATQPGSMWVLWAWDLSTNEGCGTLPPARTFTIGSKLTPNVKRVVDMYGQPVPLKGAIDTLTFPLDARPVYIEWTR
jgi:hypothetical protein